MSRKTIDVLASAAGLVTTVVLIVAGVYFMQRYNFADNNVRDQLRAQKIFFPPASALEPEERQQPGVRKYAGQQVDNGDKAQVYANQFIGLHLKGIADGKTYSQLSTESRANPDDEELAGQVQSAFRGEALRGLLLTTYGFWQLGQEARLMMFVSFAGAGIILVLSLLGFAHSFRSRDATVERVPERRAVDSVR
jgi:hypothetical protein